MAEHTSSNEGSKNIVKPDLNTVRSVLLNEYQFFIRNKENILSENLPNTVIIDTSFQMLESSAKADLTLLENIVHLDIVIERFNTRIAMSYLNLVEDYDVEFKYLTRIPSMLFKLHINKLKILKKLVFNGLYCQIIHISSDIGSLVGLKELDISGCWIDHLPESIKNLENLEILKIRHNSINCLPDEIDALSHLKELDISYNSELKTLPRGIGNLKHLKKLSVDHGEFEALPEEIGNLSDLREIVADHNRITKLPKSFKKLKNLKTLDIHDNKLRTLSKSIQNLPVLEYVNLSGNLIKDIEP